MAKSIIALSSFILMSFILGSCSKTNDPGREKIEFNDSWRFELKDSVGFSKADFNDTKWRLLDLPHDWSIEGEFNKDNPAGVGGGALPGGTGWYRKSFLLPESDSTWILQVSLGRYLNTLLYQDGFFS